jgi:hemerythrin-like domain-containing protein
MEVTDILIEEHRIIERVLSAVETQARRLQAGTPVRPGFFLDATSFFRNFIDGCHHRKEEESFFMAMMDAGLSNQTGPVAIMIAEHEQGREYTRAMEKAARALAGGQASARDNLTRNALEYVALLRQHIRRENNLVFKMAEQLIPPARQKELTEEFERIEREETGAGIHEKYHRLAEAMEKEASA